MTKAWVALCLGVGLIACASVADDGASQHPEDSRLAALFDDDAGTASDENFELRVVTLGLEAPYEVLWGPDAKLWVTERIGKRVVRIDPQTGARTTALEVTDAVQTGGQDGVLGLVFHPELLLGQGNDFVYLSYSYDASPDEALDLRIKLVRYTYDASNETLVAPQLILQGLPGSTDHNSAKLLFGPDAKLYYTIGDQGHNQFTYTCLTIRAQDLPTAEEVARSDWSAYQGKVLRMNLDGSIPDDNPILGGVRSHVFSYGHRNAQGIAFAPDGTLYESEHGPKTDDEVNLIEPGHNYGWPNVAGYIDDRAYVYGNWSASSPTPCAELEFSDYALPASVPQQRESEWSHPDFTLPLITFYTVDTGFNFMDPACAGIEYICWPTIAPSSLRVYAPEAGAVPGWENSLLLTSLKEGSVFRVPLSADGRSVAGPGVPQFKTTNRYRALAIAPDARRFYVITDSGGPTSGPMHGVTTELEHLGAVLEFRYLP